MQLALLIDKKYVLYDVLDYNIDYDPIKTLVSMTYKILKDETGLDVEVLDVEIRDHFLKAMEVLGRGQ